MAKAKLLGDVIREQRTNWVVVLVQRHRTPRPRSSGVRCYSEQLAVSAGSDGRSFPSTIFQLSQDDPGQEHRELLLAVRGTKLNLRDPLDLRAQDPQIGP